MGLPTWLFSFFSITNFAEKTVDVTGVQTRIVGVEDKHADHLTTTTTTANISAVFDGGIINGKKLVLWMMREWNLWNEW